jgi:hypothetical protein
MLAISATCTIAAPANAATLINTGVASPAGNQWGMDGFQYLAAEFSLSSADTIRSVEGYIGGIVPQIVTIKIFGDGGDIPGSVLYSGSFASAITSAGAAQWQGLFGQNWALNAGTYWVGFEGTATNTVAYYGYLNGSAPNPLLNEAFSVGGTSPYGGQDNLDLSIRITSDLAAGVPEPSTWLMMLVGFGAIGFAMRRKQRQTVRINFA